MINIRNDSELLITLILE